MTYEEMIAAPLLGLNAYIEGLPPGAHKTKAEEILAWRTGELTPYLQDGVSKNKSGGLGPGGLETPPPPPNP